MRGKEIQAKNVHPHRMSRGGYNLLEEKIVAEKLKQRQEATQSDDPSIVITHEDVARPTRHKKWKKARQTNTGDYLYEETRIVAQKIVSNSAITYNLKL